jgi:hypothetical protein
MQIISLCTVNVGFFVGYSIVSTVLDDRLLFSYDNGKMLEKSEQLKDTALVCPSAITSNYLPVRLRGNQYFLD